MMLIKICIHVDLFTVRNNMKKIIITGCPRTGSTALVYLLSSSPNVLVTNELATFHNREEEFNKSISDPFVVNENKKFLDNKPWSIKQIINYKNEDYTDNKFKFFGDKRPDYCINFAKMEHLIDHHQDAYFIFTYRNPCATAWSFKKRTIVEPDPNAEWYAKDVEQACYKMLIYTNNWLSTLYPRVKNKIIIDYDDYINSQNELVDKLEIFLGDKLNIQNAEQTYRHQSPFEYKQKLNQWEQRLITNTFSIMQSKIDKLK